MLEIKVENKTISDIILNDNNIFTFTSNHNIMERMRIKFYCDGISGKTYVEGFINQIYSRQKVIDSIGFEYSCEFTADLILF